VDDAGDVGNAPSERLAEKPCLALSEAPALITKTRHPEG